MLTQAMVWDVWRGIFKDVDIFVTRLKHCLPTKTCPVMEVCSPISGNQSPLKQLASAL